VFDRDDGTYLVTWNVEATGPYTMRILLHRLQVHIHMCTYIYVYEPMNHANFAPQIAGVLRARENEYMCVHVCECAWDQ